MDFDGLSLPQLRAFVIVVEEGSFSGGARRMRRGQSAVTYVIQKLEKNVGSELFDRSNYRAKLTDAGRALLPRAQRVVEAAEAFHSQVRAMNVGIEPELAIVVDAMFPMHIIFEAFSGLEAAFPTVQTRLYVESMGATIEKVLTGTADIGFVIDLAGKTDDLSKLPLTDICLVPVAAPHHALALRQLEHGDLLEEGEISGHLQLVLTDKTERTRGNDRGVLSSRTWRLADLGAKHAMLLAGLGWGNMPAHMVDADIAAGRLIALRTPDAPEPEQRLRIATAAVHRRNKQLGPAARWFLDRAVAESR